MIRLVSCGLNPVSSKVGSWISSVRIGASFSLSHSPLILLRARLSSAKSCLVSCFLSRMTGTVPVYWSSLRALTLWCPPIMVNCLSAMMGSTTPKCSRPFFSFASSSSLIVLGFLAQPRRFWIGICSSFMRGRVLRFTIVFLLLVFRTSIVASRG